LRIDVIEYPRGLHVLAAARIEIGSCKPYGLNK